MPIAAGVAELADATDSKSVSRKGVWVRVPPSVLVRQDSFRWRRQASWWTSGSSEGKTLGYVFGMFAVVTMIGIGLGAVFFIFGEGPKSSSGH